MSKLLLILAVMALFAVSANVANAQSPTAPTISTVAITSSPGTDNTYTTLDVITVGVTFSEAVTATGTPQITLNIGGKERTADYSGAGTATGQLLFTYTVQPVDQDDDGIAVVANNLTLNGGTIQATDDSMNATLTHSAMTFADHKVDTELVLISNMEQADGTALRINAGETIRLSFQYWNSIKIYNLNQIVLDVKTPSDTLTLTVSTLNTSSQYTISTTFTGSVAAAGRQSFRSNDFTVMVPGEGAIEDGEPYVFLTATGTGFVDLGTTESTVEDVGAAYRWAIGDSVGRSTDGGTTYTTLASAHIPRFSVVGHTRETLRILAADIVSEPYNGTAYAAGEHIEARIILNGPVRALATPLTVPIQLGEGAENHRDARLVNIRGNYDSFKLTLDGSAIGHYIVYFAYTVQPGDMDTDGVVLSVDPLGRASDRNIEYALDNRVSMELSYPAQTPGAGHKVDGSQISGCDAVHCAYVTAVEDSDYSDPRKVAGFFELAKLGDLVGNVSGRLWSYGNREYFLMRNIVNSVKPTGSAVPEVWFTQPLQNRAIERLGWELGGRVFAFDDADAVTFDAPTIEEEGHEHIQINFWSTTGVRWNAGDRVLTKIVEVPVTATFDAGSYTGDEGGTVDVRVTLGESFETKTVTLPIRSEGSGGATAPDYSGIPSELVFAPGETTKTFTVMVTDDDVDDDDESITLSFGAAPTTVKTGGDHETATITIRDDDDPEVEVEFGETTYTAPEGGTATVEVTLSADPERTVTIPVTKTNQGGATSVDYSGVPSSVTFNAGQTSRTFTFTAAQDTVDDDGESVRLAFGGTLPSRVSMGARSETTVTITDDDDPEVSVSFEQAQYSVDEGQDIAIKVVLSADPERSVAIPISRANLTGASNADYSVPANVTFASGDTEKTITFTTTQDTIDDDGEKVRLGFGSLPARVAAGTTSQTTVSITDDDDPQVSVSFGANTYAVAEGETRTISLTLNADPERTVAIPVVVGANHGGATSADYSGVPASVTFNAGQTSRTLTFTATQDTLDDDDESVRLEFGTLPARVSEGARDETTVNIRDDDDPEVTVSFGAATYTAAEGGTATVEVRLSADPERTVVIPLTKTDQGGVDPLDYSGVPSSVTFNSGQTSRTFTFTAAQDTVDDDGESVKLEFGALPSRVSEGSKDETTVNIQDDDDPEVTVSFGAVMYTAPEDGMVTVMVTVILSGDPERTVEILITKAEQGGATSADYSGVPSSVIFNPGEISKSFTFTATQDTVDDDGESVKLEFGMLPGRVSGGTTDEATVIIRDDDDPEVTVAFVQDAYRVVEGRTITVRITLSADPERTVVIPLSKTEQNGASSADYSGVPESVTFNTGETSKTLDFAATDDTISDTGESVKLTFGALPERVSEGTPAETTVNIRQVSAQFQLDCSQAEWCADLKLDDYTAVDWGWSQLQYNGSFSPPANLSVKSFIFRGVEYTIRAVYVVPGIYPEIDNAYNRVQRGQGEFLMSISHGETWEAAPEGHYQDWELHIGGVVLPFGEAVLWGKRWFLWYGLEFQELFTDWTSSTVNKIGIREIPSVQHLPTVPPAPAYVSAAAQDSDGLRVSWRSPWTRQRNQAITGYIVQWKQASHSWSDSPRVSSMSVGPKSISAQVNGMTEGVLYTVRVIATNAVGDGPPSEDAIGRPQSQSPRLLSAVVSGQTLTLRYNRQLDTNSVPAKSAFVVIAGLGLREVSAVSLSGMEVTLTLARAVTSVDKVQAAYVAPADASGTFLRDTEGNHAYTMGGDLPSVTNETDPALLQPLTAQFTNVPGSHDGEDSFTFNIEFSESVWVDAGLGKDNLLQVTGGTVTAAHWLDRRTERWEVTIKPNTNGDIVVVLPGGRTCSASGAPCAAGDRILSGDKTATISGPTSQQQAVNTPATGAPGISGTAGVGETLTATTSAIQDEDGMTGAVFAYQWVRHNLATETDTDIEGASGQTYAVTAEDGGKALKVRVTFTDDAGNEESLTSYAVIASPSLRRTESLTTKTTTTELTASVHGAPQSHDGQTTFTFELRLSEAPKADFSYRTLQDHAFTVTGGTLDGVQRLEPPGNILWEIRVSPDSSDDVTIVLPVTKDCEAQGAICTEDGRPLSNSLEISVSGPVAPVVALTATVENAPSTHDGSTAFTFELRFSEAPADAFSYVTLRHHTFTVTGGSVSNVRRLEPGKNVRWEITVTPDSTGDVTIVLPVATDCEAEHAICTGDGRPLSNRLEITVSGSDG